MYGIKVELISSQDFLTSTLWAAWKGLVSDG
jgi:hypothetical protein